MKNNIKFYTREEVFNETLKYFGGDELAANVWINKYALKDSDGNIYELTPDDMHKRLASEFSRIENNYSNPISYDEIYELIKNFKYIIPQGSPMAGIGNNFQTVSLSNCFVVGNEADSYGGIYLTDQEQAQLMKRRGGVGHDLSHIRPKGSHVKNSALTSTGVVPFMERYSNTTREVAQDGRRGALMLSISIEHPDSEDFIDAKMEQGKVTGANVSVKITDKFMKSVIKNEKFFQQYPIDEINPKIIKESDSLKIWKKIIHNAWKSAEPGVLFWDTIVRESVPDCYIEYGFKTVSTNPCGEIPLCPYDSCRLLALNLFSYVENPFTDKAKFNFDLFKKHVHVSMKMMDDLIDLENEKIDKILEKIEKDPENLDIKRVEKELWLKIKEKTIQGRRTGLGVTAEGDMLAALGLIYGTKEATDFSVNVHKILAIESYRTSCIMAKDRGAFPIYSYEKEISNPFVLRIKKEDKEIDKMLKETGRRNIAMLTSAPTGTVSLMTQTTSGIEPVFLPVYKRNRKVNPNDKNVKISFVDEVGDAWETYTVFHHKFIDWLKINNYNIEEVKKMSDDEISEIVKKSPYYKATSADVDYIEKVKMQGAIQKWVDHSISVTINMPENVTEDMVAKAYEEAWKSGCKGMTVYREGSRSGVLVSNKKKEKTEEVNAIIKENNAPKRPKDLECDVIRFTNKGEKWIAFVGKDKEGLPYELFTGMQESFLVPSYVEKGIIRKNKEEYTDIDGQIKMKSRYDFIYFDVDGVKQTLVGLSRAFKAEYWDWARTISAFLRHRIHLPSVINLIDTLHFDGDLIGTWKAGVKRILKKYIIEDEKDTKMSKCPECGQNTLTIQNGCYQCVNETCGYSKCG